MNYQSPNAPPIPQRPTEPRGIEICNIKEGEVVYQRFLLVYGRAGFRNGIFDQPLYVVCNDFPQTEWPCVNSHFKALVHLVPGPNTITFALPAENQTLHFHVNYLPLLQNPPLSLVIFLASDSPAKFDVPPEKKGQNNLSVAVEKLRVAGYMWQAFCAEQMHRNGMGRRTFRLDEAWLPDTISCKDKGTMRNTAKVHIIRSQYSMAEIRDKRRAQQSKDHDASVQSLFGLFLDDLRNHPPFNKPSIVAGLILDAHWDCKSEVTLGHAALGGASGHTALGIFGSHLLHAWPSSIEDIVPSLLDNTKTDTRYVANDANESGTWWKAANIGMGAMLHEVGHAFTLNHSPSGIMSRGYNNWNRTFLAKEPGRGPITPQEEEGSQWHRVDILRLRFHPAFRIPEDGPIGVKDLSKPSFTALENNHLQISSPAGLTLIEILVNGRYRTHYEFVQEQPKSITLSLSDICQKCSCDLNREQVSLAAVCANQEHKQLDHLSNFLSSHRVTNLQGLNGIILKSDIYGASSEEGKDKSFAIFFDNNQQRKQLRRIKVNHGAFLDGFTLIYKDGSQSQVGKTDGGCSEFDISPGEQIQGFYVSNGAWIDGIQFKLSSGRVSPWFGGKGGGISHVEPPEGYEIVGVFASAARWMEQFGIFYRRC